MLRPVAGLLFILFNCNCAVTDQRDVPRDRLEGTGNEPSIAIGVVAGGNFTDGSFSIGYGKGSTNGTAGPGADHVPLDRNPNTSGTQNIPDLGGNTNGGLVDGHNDISGHDTAQNGGAIQNGGADQTSGTKEVKRPEPSSAVTCQQTFWLLSGIVLVYTFMYL